MNRACRLVASTAMIAGAASGCGGVDAPSESPSELTQALDVCGETVPANRFVDGLPAYAQCAATMNSAIWSNNGIDTATSSQGPGWVRTQFSGGYQCTEWAWRYMHFKWNVDYRSGNAGEWCDGNLPPTLVKSTVPVHGDLIVFAPGVCGADGTTGHVAVIDTVDMAGGNVTFVEENRAGRRSAKQSCAACFLHAVANDGSSNGGSGGSAGASSGTGGVSGSTSSGGVSATGGASTKGGSSSSAGTTSSGGRLGTAGAGTAGTAGVGGLAGASAGGSVAGPGNAGSPAAGRSNAGGPSSGGAAGSGAAASGAAGSGAPGSGGSGLTMGSGGSPGSAGAGSGAVSGSSAGASRAGQSARLDPEAEVAGCSVARGPNAARASAVAPWSWLLLALLLRRRAPRRAGGGERRA